MRTYTFRYKHGQSAPYKSLGADDDTDFFKTVLPAWEKSTGFKYIPYSVTCTVLRHRNVPELTKDGLVPFERSFRDAMLEENASD